MRHWHRWISLFASLFLISTAVTGVVLQVQGLLNEDETATETLSPQEIQAPLEPFLNQVSAAQAKLQQKYPKAVLERLELQFKGEHPTFVFHLDMSENTPDPQNQIVTVNARTGAIEKESPEPEESLIMRLHTGEILGDSGKILGALWGLALLALAVSGLLIYFGMVRRRMQIAGVKKYFWK